MMSRQLVHCLISGWGSCASEYEEEVVAVYKSSTKCLADCKTLNEAVDALAPLIREVRRERENDEGERERRGEASGEEKRREERRGEERRQVNRQGVVLGGVERKRQSGSEN